MYLIGIFSLQLLQRTPKYQCFILRLTHELSEDRRGIFPSRVRVHIPPPVSY